MIRIVEDGCRNPRRQAARGTKSCASAPYIFRSLVRTFWRPDLKVAPGLFDSSWDHVLDTVTVA